MIDLRIGDCIERMKEMEDNSVDLILCDPPYELTSVSNSGSKSKAGKGFMGKAWDGSGIAFDVDMWKEVNRVLKPNGYCLAFSGTRTYHRMTKAIEEAEFEIQGISEYCYGSGFPKSLDISKVLDKKLGVERTETYIREDFAKRSNKKPQRESQCICGEKGVYTLPASDIAKQYEGYKTSLKPAKEPIVIARKLSNNNVVPINFLPFIYCAKASKKERNGDIHGNNIGINNHPTVKPLKIIQELFEQAINKEQMVVLDMFAGSGSTGVAIEKFNIENGTNHKCILIEKEEEYAEIIKKRCCLEEV